MTSADRSRIDYQNVVRILESPGSNWSIRFREEGVGAILPWSAPGAKVHQPALRFARRGNARPTDGRRVGGALHAGGGPPGCVRSLGRASWSGGHADLPEDPGRLPRRGRRLSGDFPGAGTACALGRAAAGPGQLASRGCPPGCERHASRMPAADTTNGGTPKAQYPAVRRGRMHRPQCTTELACCPSRCGLPWCSATWRK